MSPEQDQATLAVLRRWRIQTGLAADGPRPDPTPSDGPDPYGNPNGDPEWLRIDWREHLRSLELRGARVNYVDLGPLGSPAEPTEPGPTPATEPDAPLLLIHGLGGCWQNFLENIPHFARHHRVVALDLPGFGKSPVPEWEITIPTYGQFVRDFCVALDVGPAVLVGNSMGGFVAAEAAIEEPDLLSKLVLISSVGISNVRLKKGPAEAAARMAAAMAPLAFRFREASLRRPGLRDAAFNNVFRYPRKLRPELLWEQYQGAMGYEGGLIAGAFIPAVGALAGYDFTDRLEAITAPTLIVWGRSDRIVPPQDAAEFERHLTNSRVVIFERCGHLPQLERPVRFNRLLEEFLAE